VIFRISDKKDPSNFKEKSIKIKNIISKTIPTPLPLGEGSKADTNT
jgi:hypothetical protein